MKNVRSLPAEFYLLLAAPTLLLILDAVVSLRSNVGSEPWSGGELLGIKILTWHNALFALLGATALLLIVMAISRLDRSRNFNKISFLVSAGALAGICLLSLYAMSVSTLILYLEIPISRIIDASSALASFEYSIFQALPAFTVQASMPAFMDKAMAYSYNLLDFLAPLTLVLTAIGSKKLFRAYIISFMLFFLIAYACWIALPSLNPGMLLFLQHSVNYQFPENAAASLAQFHPHPYLSSIVHHSSNYMNVDDPRSFNVSNFPSAHAGWGFLAAFFAISLCPILSIIYIPWLILNAISTFYLLQHFAVDSIAGVLIGALSARFGLLLAETGERKPAGGLFYALEIMNAVSRPYLNGINKLVSEAFMSIIPKKWLGGFTAHF